jgi:hypothetical protein
VFDTAHIGFVFTDVIRDGHCGGDFSRDAGCRVVNNNMPPDTTIAAASEKNTVRITWSGRILIVMVSPNNVPHRLSHRSAADLGASKSVEQAFTRAELGYVSPGGSRISLN